MNQNTMDDDLSYEEIGHLLVAKGQKLEHGEGDPEDVIRSVMETLSRTGTVRPREKTVDQNGRVSVGRDYAGKHGFALFHPDERDRDSRGDGDE